MVDRFGTINKPDPPYAIMMAMARLSSDKLAALKRAFTEDGMSPDEIKQTLESRLFGGIRKARTQETTNPAVK
jgi:hypothetical protein